MKNKVMILAAAITLVACGGNQQKKAVSEKVKADAVKVDMHDAESSLDYQGTYTGVFPAADCPGIDMRLTLKKDGTYSLHMKYLDRDSEFDEKGAYKVKGNLLTLTPHGRAAGVLQGGGEPGAQAQCRQTTRHGGAGRKLRIEENRIKPLPDG